MNNRVKVFNDKEKLADAITHEFVSTLNKEKSKKYIALSGGNTPLLFFKKLSESDIKLEWNNIHFFWCDERCVPPSDNESNYGMIKKVLLDNENIPVENIHRIKGEDEPFEEAKRYSAEINRIVPSYNNIPCFDWIFLGVGDDGHTASIFPDQIHLIKSQKIAQVAHHPVTGQKRITLTGNVLKNARRITFLVTGENKKKVIKKIFDEDSGAKMYPAYFIKALHGKTEWYLDKDSASFLENNL